MTLVKTTEIVTALTGISLIAAAFSAVIVVILSVKKKKAKFWLILMLVFFALAGIFWALSLSSIFSIYNQTSAFD